MKSAPKGNGKAVTVVRQGHTSSGKDGSNPNAKGATANVTDLKVPAK